MKTSQLLLGDVHLPWDSNSGPVSSTPNPSFDALVHSPKFPFAPFPSFLPLGASVGAYSLFAPTTRPVGAFPALSHHMTSPALISPSGRLFLFHNVCHMLPYPYARLDTRIRFLHLMVASQSHIVAYFTHMLPLHFACAPVIHMLCIFGYLGWRRRGVSPLWLTLPLLPPGCFRLFT